MHICAQIYTLKKSYRKLNYPHKKKNTGNHTKPSNSLSQAPSQAGDELKQRFFAEATGVSVQRGDLAPAKLKQSHSLSPRWKVMGYFHGYACLFKCLCISEKKSHPHTASEVSQHVSNLALTTLTNPASHSLSHIQDPDHSQGL